MNPTVVAALIGAAASIIVNLISAWQQNSKRRLEEATREARLEERLKSIEKKLDEHNGYAQKIGGIQQDIANGTTIPITLTVGDSGDVDLTAAINVYVTLAQGNTTITLTGEDLSVTSNTVEFNLTQAQSLNLSVGTPVSVQVNWTYYDVSGKVQRAATKTKKITVTEQLLKQVIA